MADALTSAIDLIHPAMSGIGVITNDQIWVVFDREVDESTVEDGNFFVTGPDQDTWSGPDLQVWEPDDVDADDILQSPVYAGIVPGTISFQRLDPSSTTIISGIDTVGSGYIYRTKAIFTPTNQLAPDTTYTVYLSGDEDTSDSIDKGISERTVFDPLASGINTGTGSAEFDGGYIGIASTDRYHIQITTAGDVGTARFQFYRDQDPLSIFGPFKTKQSPTLLSDGVSVSFTNGTYAVGDAWYSLVKSPATFSGSITWPFDTGSGSILEIPSIVSTSIIGDTITTTATSSSSTDTFGVVSTAPVDGATNQTITSDYSIVVVFDSDIAPATVVSGVDVLVFTEAATGEASVPASGYLIAKPEVSGDTLTIYVADSQLMENNLVVVTLDGTIANTSGVSLGDDYTFEFSTHYNPFYCTVRRLRLEIGMFIQNIPDDTLSLAIHLASLEAENLTWNTDNSGDSYYEFVRSQWTCCRAQEMMLINTIGTSGSLKAKKLGDLSVEYNTNSGNLQLPLERAIECRRKWELSLMAGGRQVQTPTAVVKGCLDVDRPPIGRGWVHSRDFDNAQTPVTNRKVRLTGTRRFRGIFSKSNKGWWDR